MAVPSPASLRGFKTKPGVLTYDWTKTGGRSPAEGWVWPAPTHSGHVESCSLKKQHGKALRLSKVRPFVPYRRRHTFLTRLGESGCDVWTLVPIAGHSSISISPRCVHPSEDAVLDAMSRLGGHKIGHNAQQPQLPAAHQKQKPHLRVSRNMVDVAGLEPATPCLQSRCSPS
jgi:hypothetical protein